MSDIYIEGNIGTGKTTFLRFLETLFKTDDYSFIFEPVDQWTNLTDSDGINLLENFYKDQDKWSFAFQMNSFISRIQKIQNDSKKVKFIERSVYTDRNCFAKNCYESGKMNKIEYDIYTRWHDWLCKEFKVKPSAFIYLKTNPTVSLERIQKRSRQGDARRRRLRPPCAPRRRAQRRRRQRHPAGPRGRGAAPLPAQRPRRSLWHGRP